MAQETNYNVNTWLRARGGFVGQMARYATSIDDAHRKLTNIGRETERYGRMVQGTTAATAMGWARTGATMGALATGAGLGGLVRQGLAFNMSMENSRLQAASMFQMFNFGAEAAKVISGETTQWEHNLQASRAVMGELFDIAKKTPATYGQVTRVYQSAVTGLATQTQDLNRHLEFMRKASLLGGLAGGDYDVLGAQMGRIMSGSAGAEMGIWKALQLPILEAGKAMGAFPKKMGSDMAKVTESFNKLTGDARLQIMMKAMEKIGPQVAESYATSMAGIQSTTLSAIETMSGKATAPLYEGWRSFLIRINREGGVFGAKNMHKWVSFAEQAGIKLADYADNWLRRVEGAATYVRDNWVTVMQTMKNAGVIVAAAIKGAFFVGVTRMLVGAGMVAAGRGFQAAGMAKKGLSTVGGFLGSQQRAAHVGIVRGMKGKGQGMMGGLGRGLTGGMGMMRKGLLASVLRFPGLGKKLGGLGSGQTFQTITKFLASAASFAVVIGAGLPVMLMAAAAFGSVFVIVGGLAAYIVANWKSISSSIVQGLRDGTITLQPMLIALYTFWARLKIVGETFLGAGSHAQKFNGLLSVFTTVIEIASGGVSFFMRAIAYSLGIWASLKLAFQGVLRAVLAIIEAASYLPGGPSDDTVARARANYRNFAQGVMDDFTKVDRLLTKADEIDNFKFGAVDLKKIEKDAAKLEKSLAEMLEGKSGKGKLKTAKGPRVNIGKVEIIQDLRDQDPDRLMAAFIKPLQRIADRRVQAYDALEEGV